MIDNADQPLTLADGSCAPALSSLGAASPIAEAPNATVSMVRYTAMHVVGDYQLVYNGGMGPITPTHPAAAIQDAARAEFTTTTSAPHAAPNGMELDNFAAVTTGGAACQP